MKAVVTPAQAAVEDNYMDEEAAWVARVNSGEEPKPAAPIYGSPRPFTAQAEWVAASLARDKERAQKDRIAIVTAQQRPHDLASCAKEYLKLQESKTVTRDHWNVLKSTVKVNDDDRMPSKHDFVHPWVQESPTFRILPPLDGQEMYQCAYQHYYPKPSQCPNGEPAAALSDACPICKFYREQLKRVRTLSDDEPAKCERLLKTLKKFEPQRRFYYNVLVKGDHRPKLLSAPPSLHQIIQNWVKADGIESVYDGRFINVSYNEDQEFNANLADTFPSALGTLAQTRLVLSQMRSLPLVVKSWEKPKAVLDRILHGGTAKWEDTLSQEFPNLKGSMIWTTVDKCIKKSLQAGWICTQDPVGWWTIQTPAGTRLAQLVLKKNNVGSYDCKWYSWDAHRREWKHRASSHEKFIVNQRSQRFEDSLRFNLFAYSQES
jgi:hypothetical protein